MNGQLTSLRAGATATRRHEPATLVRGGFRPDGRRHRRDGDASADPGAECRGIAVQAAAIVLMVWARLTFGRRSFHAAANPTSGGLVTSGPYRFVRHPIYAAACYFVWAGALDHRSLTAVLGALLLTAGAVGADVRRGAAAERPLSRLRRLSPSNRAGRAVYSVKRLPAGRASQRFRMPRHAIAKAAVGLLSCR